MPIDSKVCNQDGVRLDSFVTESFDSTYSRSFYKRLIDDGKITLSHKELLGTWQENADKFGIGETVTGIVRSIESYGIFVELKPNLAGLAELKPDIEVGSKVSVYIKAIIPQKMKIKLIIVDSFGNNKKEKPSDIEYYITSGSLKRWKYSADGADKTIVTDFGCQ